MKLNFTQLFLSGIFVLISLRNTIAAQPLNCSGTTVMYATFNDTTGTRPTAIHPVTYASGAIGPAMGTGQFAITAPDGVSKGTALLAACPFTGRLYYMTAMSTSGGTKGIYSFDPVTGASVRIATTPATLNNYHFVKAAVHPNQYIYALGVHRQPGAGDQVLIRFSTCGAVPTPGCGTVEILGYIPAASIPATSMFNGDLAFSIFGDMYIAVSKINTATNLFTDAYMYKISAGNIPNAPGTGNIPATFAYDLDLLDGTAVNGVAFDAAGDLFVSTIRNSAAGRLSELYEVFSANNLVKVNTFGTVPVNCVVTDLASCVFPGGVLNNTFISQHVTAIENAIHINWDILSAEGIKYFEVQRKKKGENNFTSIKRADAIQSKTNYHETDYVLQPQDEIYEYRIVQTATNGQLLYSNTSVVIVKGNVKAVKMLPNPFTSAAEILFSTKINGSVYLKIFNAEGVLVWKDDVFVQPGTMRCKLKGADFLSAGTYFLEVFAPAANLYNRQQIVRL